MADWLALHGLTAEQCRQWLTTVPEAVSMPAEDADAPVGCRPEAVWQACAEVASARMPGARAAVETVMADVRVTFAPDRARYPRAFTLHDDGHGRPFVSCPWAGRRRDVLMLAHEFGHALQIVASAGRAMPPVLRETCAALSEGWLADAAGDLLDMPGLAALHRARCQADLERDLPVLLAALETPGAAYAYRWNYPPALVLARTHDLPAWELFQGLPTLPELIGGIGVDG